jgi:hypothetical protein
MIANVGSKTKEQLLEEFSQKNSHNTLEGEQYTAAIMVKSAADIESAVTDFKAVAKNIGDSSGELSKKLLWLNIVLTIATAVGAIATVILVFKR